MAANKTQPTSNSVIDYLNTVDNNKRREDAFVLLDLFDNIMSEKAVLWGESLIGYGEYHYKYESGREGDFFLTGFSPRKQNLSIYIMPGFKKYTHLLTKLGKHKAGAACLYINKIEDIDITILKQLIKESADYMRTKYNAV
tara:strand:- start:303 stop:725 length:423 start_codon:yes stop_codon:yes gene_type:complete